MYVSYKYTVSRMGNTTNAGNTRRSEEASLARLEEVLAEVLPGSQLRVLERAHGEAIRRSDLEVEFNGVRLLVDFLESTSRVRLADTAEILRRECEAYDCTPVLAATYLSPSKQELLRGLRTAFLDLAGNAWIVAPGIHIDRRGFPNRDKEPRERRDIYSDKATLVLRVLLTRQKALGVREIAAIVRESAGGVGLSPGYVSKVAAELERRGYAGRRGDKVLLRHGPELLADWVAAYRSRRKPKNRGYFLPSPEAEALLPSLAPAFNEADVKYVFTGHAGASLVARFALFDVVDVYVKDAESADGVLTRMGAREVERGANVMVGLPHYLNSGFFDYQIPKPGMRTASDIQLYLDLYDHPVRGREQAGHLYERQLARLVEREGSL